MAESTSGDEATILGRPMDVISLSLGDRDRLSDSLLGLPDPQADTEETLLTLYPLFAQLTREALRGVVEFDRAPFAAGAILFRGLPTDPVLPPTQTDGQANAGKTTYVSEGCLLGLAQLLGEPVGFTSEKSGRLIHDVVPVPGTEDSLSNQGSTGSLPFHNDMVYDGSGYYHRLNPDFLILTAIRTDPERKGRTICADARVIIERLDAADVNTLRQPLYRMNAPEAYCMEHAEGEAVLSEPVPILSGPSVSPEIALASNGVRPSTEEAQQAYERLEFICAAPDVASRVLLEPGDALLIDNRKVVHTRSVFWPRYDGSDRWLQRSQVRRSLWPLRHRLVSGARVYS
jgi:L-asparagine oxygenase